MTELVIEHIVPNGDCALLIKFALNEHRLAGIHSLCADLLQSPMQQQLNVIPAADSLVVVFSSPITRQSHVVAEIHRRTAQVQVIEVAHHHHEIPVCYHPDVAPDLLSVCQHLKVDIPQLIAWHVAAVYQVNMLGFLPGFVYLAGNHTALQIPRKTTPSLAVPAGSVAIAGQQTGLYALASPGGWHVIGRTPRVLLDWQQPVPAVLAAMDTVSFKAISLAEFERKQ